MMYRAATMTRDDFYNTVKESFPDISAKADKEYIRLWDEFTDSEFYSYSWFEALANALNREMCIDTPPEEFIGLFRLISHSFNHCNDEIKKTVDVAFVENLFWQVPQEKAKKYWLSLPNNLKDLYLNFHHRKPY
jgi:hypothetical protein